MEIAKYIGLFLLKNEYCYLPGIGGLKIVRTSAAYSGQQDEIEAPKYKIIFNKGIGAIDDSFANFIATNERISISLASNKFKEYYTQAKEDLNEGKEVIIPSIGKFYKTKNDEVTFETDPQLEIHGKSIPLFKISPTAEKHHEKTISEIIDNTNIIEPKGDEEIVIKAPQVNWGKLILLGVVILAVLGAIGYFIFGQLNNTPVEEKNASVEPTPYVEEMNTAEESMPEDTAILNNENNNSSSSVVPSDGNTVSIVINSYPTEAQANTRVQRLNSYGHGNVSMLRKDDQTFLVIKSYPANIDTSSVVDSLKRFFGGNVFVLE